MTHMKISTVLIWIFFVLELVAGEACAQSGHSVYRWERIWGGDDEDSARSVRATPDGGYVVLGWTISENTAKPDVWGEKINNQGQQEWKRTMGGVQNVAITLHTTFDNSYIMAGITDLKSMNLDGWVAKLDAHGEQIWERSFGSSENEAVMDIQTTHDGGYVLAGIVYQQGDTSALLADGLVVKLDAQGHQEWKRTFGKMKNRDWLETIQTTRDRGYVMVISTQPFHEEPMIWVIKLDSRGEKVWERTFLRGWTGSVTCAIRETSDDGYIIVSSILPPCGELSVDDVWVIKLDTYGEKIWERSFGECKNDDEAEDVQVTPDGGCIVAANTRTAESEQKDIWLIKLDKQGNKHWERTFGGSKDDIAYAIQTTPDGGYIVAGSTASADAGKSDAWLLKLDSQGLLHSD